MDQEGVGNGSVISLHSMKLISTIKIPKSILHPHIVGF